MVSLALRFLAIIVCIVSAEYRRKHRIVEIGSGPQLARRLPWRAAIEIELNLIESLKSEAGRSWPADYHGGPIEI